MSIFDINIIDTLNSFVFRHNWEWPVWGIFIVGIMLIAVGYLNKKNSNKSNENTMYAQVGLFITLSVLELTQFIFAEKRIWFVKPDEVGWLWTIINGLLMITIFFYQVRLFKRTLDLANEHANRQCSWLWGLIGLPVSIIAAIWLLSYGHAYWAIVVLVIPQALQVGIAIQATMNGGKDWPNFGLTLAVYFIGGLAVAFALIVVTLTAIIAIAGYVLLLLAGKAMESNTKPVDDETELIEQPAGEKSIEIEEE